MMFHMFQSWDHWQRHKLSVSDSWALRVSWHEAEYPRQAHLQNMLRPKFCGYCHPDFRRERNFHRRDCRAVGCYVSRLHYCSWVHWRFFREGNCQLEGVIACDALRTTARGVATEQPESTPPVSPPSGGAKPAHQDNKWLYCFFNTKAKIISKNIFLNFYLNNWSKLDRDYM